MLLHYFLADSQTYAVSGIFLACVQALEDDKNLLFVVRSDADPVVLNRKSPLTVDSFCGNLDHRRTILAEF